MTEHDFLERPDLAAEKLGGAVVYATDDYFAQAENLLKARAPEWREHAYTDRGKWMDGWESRRKRDLSPGAHDLAIVRLGLPGIVRGVVVDTAFFRGNYPEACAIDGVTLPEGTGVQALLAARWTEVLPRRALDGNSRNVFAVDSHVAFTHLRLRIFPDGGVARLRVHGDVAPDWRRIGGARATFDLAAMQSGGEVLECSDMFFGPKHNLIQPGRAPDMSDGWETRRRRGIREDTHDWVLVRLTGQGFVDRLELDTAHFKGNFPDTARVMGCDGDPAKAPFRELLPRTPMMAHTRHLFVEELANRWPFTHLRLEVYPDGGVSRLRAFGRLTDAARDEALARHLASAEVDELREKLRACCAASAFVDRIVTERPFSPASRLLAHADEVIAGLSGADLMEAFAAHPRIGERKATTPQEARWSAGEQAGAAAASRETLEALAQANREYEEKFGFVFLVCATGRTAAEMLAAARARLGNSRDEELRVAAEELRKIARLRLRKLVGA